MIGIIGAMEQEVELLRSLIRDAKTECAGNFEFSSGLLDEKEVVLLRCGIGKVNAAVGCALLVERYHPAFVLNTGSAGGVNPEGHNPLSYGDVVISLGLVQHDVDATAFNYKPGQIPGMPPVFQADEGLATLAERAIDALKAERTLPASFNYTRGLIASGDAFMHDSGRIAEVARRFPGLRALEMESAAVAQVCCLFSVPFLVIRALSDIAGEESPVTHDEFLPIASRYSCEIVRRILRLSA